MAPAADPARPSRRRIELSSPRSAADARRALRSAMSGESVAVGALLAAERFQVFGWVQDPTFRLEGLEPGDGARARAPWRPRHATRRLAGTVVDVSGSSGPGGCRLVAHFDRYRGPAGPFRRRGRARAEDRLRAWLAEALAVAGT